MPISASAGRCAGEDGLPVVVGNGSIPRGATPTSHIFKLPLGLMGAAGGFQHVRRQRMAVLAAAEGLWALPVADARIATFWRTARAGGGAIR